MALHFERSEFDARRDRLMIEMAEKKLDAMLLFAQESMYWLTGYDTFGFCFFQCLVVKADGSMVLLTRSADLRQARHTSIIENIVLWTDRDGANPALDLRNLLNDLGPARRAHRRRIRHPRPDRLQRPPARRTACRPSARSPMRPASSAGCACSRARPRSPRPRRRQPLPTTRSMRRCR